MEQSKNVEQYTASMKMVESMLDKGLIDEDDFKKSEAFLAKKYCIKPDSVYRSNHLLFQRNRVIYMNEKQEA